VSIIYLSPSMQPSPYRGGGEEQYYMNQIVNAMEPYLRVNGIKYVRSKPDSSLSQVIRESNSEYYDLHLALYSNASPENLTGRLVGTDVFYFTYGTRAKRAAEIIAENYKKIYPNPTLVKAVPSTQIAEISKTNAPAVQIQTAYHDNEQDVKWLKSNINAIAVNLAESLTRYFGVPFLKGPECARKGFVKTAGGGLNVYRRPDASADVLAQVPNNAQITILSEWKGWYVVEYKSTVGYASAKHITV
jgi:N-acetylmuramoyl-L-alanine amidase